jgi:SAM-dependent methyltransferase
MRKYHTKSNSSAYGEMAAYYDEMMGGGKYVGWRKLIAETVKKYQIPLGKCLDVACGTGNISRLLIGLGFGVIGVDMSSKMLAVARKKFPRETFVCSDVRNLALADRISRRITFAVSFYDSLNYLLSDADMLKAFRAVGRNIRTGTIFLFDMNTVSHVTAAQKYPPRVLERKQFYSVSRFGGKGRFWEIEFDTFVREGGGRYRLASERHVERGYDKGHIVPLLNKSGFVLLEAIEERKTYEDGKNRPSRTYFIAQKS